MPTSHYDAHRPIRVEVGQGPPRTPMHVLARSDDGRHLSISVGGEVDADSAHLLRLPFAGHEYESVEVDCRWVDFMGLAGVDELLSLAVRYQLRVMPSRSVQRVVELCGVADLLSLQPRDESRPDTVAPARHSAARSEPAS